MATVSPRSLVEKLNPTCRRGLMEAAGLCSSRTHFNVEVEHWLLALLDRAGTDLPLLLRHYGANPNAVRQQLTAALDQFQTGNGRAPDLSPDIVHLAKDAWLLASLEHAAGRVRGGHLLAALLSDKDGAGRKIRTAIPELGKLSGEQVQKDLKELLAASKSEENDPDAPAPGDTGPSPAVGSKTPALDKFTQNLSERAKAGAIDPVIGRDPEIRQVVDTLCRRRQNNPILTGEAGVGKTAVVEGLALRIAAGDVPPSLKDVVLRVLDLGLLQAGAGVKGEFEQRLKSVIEEVKGSPRPVILFIDEAHTLVGAGGQAGQNDAANLLKPALARGELRTIAATTFAEYKKYFEADAALKRRFQVVPVHEPDEVKAAQMLRGLVPVLEKHHQVRILDEAVTETVRLSTRFIPERQLPDKAVGLLDTVCARVHLSRTATPAPLEDVTREIEHLDAEVRFLEREAKAGRPRSDRLPGLVERKQTAEDRRATLEKQHEEEKKLVAAVTELSGELEATPDDETLRGELAEKERELARVQGETRLVHPVVDGRVVADVVAGMTGIPVGNMLRDEIATILGLAGRLGKRVVGQDHALEAIARRIQTSRAGVADPRRPVGVFLLAGPSGVGKTETALALADLLYGGDRNVITVNMSEYKEEYKVSQLIGSPRGYEGSQEGGVLTEAVRHRPHSVVLLDEVEKAHPSVQEIFYQVFDKGVLNDSRGLAVDFKNTIILLTANVGSDTIQKAFADPETAPDAEALTGLIWKDLLTAFKPALLGRMTVVPYRPLSEELLRRIVELQLGRIRDRLRESHKAEFTYDPEVVATIAARCTEVETGARNADRILTGAVLPEVSRTILGRMAEGRGVRKVHVGGGGGAQFTYTID